MDKVALARLVLTSREHVISLEARDKGLMGMLLRYPYEVRDQAEYFDEIQDVKITKDMLDLAKHIVEQKSGHFDPSKFEDHYEAALQHLLNKKQKGQPLPKAAPRRRTDNVVDLMAALRASIRVRTRTQRRPGPDPPRKQSRRDAKQVRQRPRRGAKSSLGTLQDSQDGGGEAQNG
jgi:DNA end-binding protein Ku